jgi:hypothetical protein
MPQLLIGRFVPADLAHEARAPERSRSRRVVAELRGITPPTFSPTSAGRLSETQPPQPDHAAHVDEKHRMSQICGDLMRTRLCVRGSRRPSLACPHQFGSRADAAVPMTGSTIGGAIVARPGTLTNLR